MNRGAGRIKAGMIALAVIVVAAVIIAFRLHQNNLAVKEQGEETAATIAWLESLEKGDPQTVRDTLSSRKKNQRLAEREQNRQSLLDGTIDVWSLFTDFAIIGDSRAEGFINFGFLPEDRVLAVKGEGIDNTEGWFPTLQGLNPSIIFILYGTNDMGNGVGKGWDGYKEHCRPHLQALKQTFPNADLYFVSIMPASEPAYSSNGVWAEIEEYNSSLRELCQEEGIYFLDTTDVAYANPGMYIEDGIHFISEFYELWARDMWLDIYDIAYAEEDARAAAAETSEEGTTDETDAVNSVDGTDSGTEAYTEDAGYLEDAG